MKIVDITADYCKQQKVYLPRHVFESKGLYVGCPVELELDKTTKAICTSFLPNPDVAFCKANLFVVQSPSSSAEAEYYDSITSVVKLDMPKEALDIKVVLICDNIRDTLKYNNNNDTDCNLILQLLLDGTYIKSNCVINLQWCTHPLKLGIFSLLITSVNGSTKEEETYVFGHKTVVSDLRAETRVRRQRLKKVVLAGGLDEHETRLESILLDLKLDLKGFLVSGPSGCGKTSLVHKVCHRNKHMVYSVKCSDLARPLPGETEETLRDIFEQAHLHSQEGPTVLLFEDLDLLCGGEKEVGHQIRAVSQLQALLDSAKGTALVVGATTCCPSQVHPSLRRPGRFTHELFIPVPNNMERAAIIRVLDPNLEQQQVEQMAVATQGYLGADLAAMVAAMDLKMTVDKEPFQAALREALKTTAPSGFKSGIGTVHINPISWDMIGGLHQVKKELQCAILWPLKYPELFASLDIKRTKGVLVYGPPGCGKTTLVRAAASMTGATFLSVSASSIFSPYVGDSEKALSEVFHKARLGAPTVLFIDEIDSIVANRDGSSGSSGVQEKVLSVLLNEMDGIGHKLQEACRPGSTPDIIVVGATNRPDMLDAALCRPGRLDKMIYIPEPDEQSRLEILKVVTSKMPLSKDVILTNLAAQTKGFSGADLDSLCREAALDTLTMFGLDSQEVSAKSFSRVLASFKPSITAAVRIQYESFTQLF